MITEPMIHGFLLYVLIGVFAGFMSGLFGIGGGIVVVPALLYIFQTSLNIPSAQIMRFAVGSSLAIMLLTTLIAVRAHHRLGEIRWSVFKRLWPGILTGVLLGSIAANFLPSHWLKIAFGLFLLFMSWKMLLGVGQQKRQQFPAAWINAAITNVIGFLSGLLGIGGGTLIIPYLTYCGIEPRKITAITLLCSLVIAVVGSIIFIVLGCLETKPMAFSLGYIYWPAVLWVSIPSMLFAPFGVKVTYILPVKQLRYAFVVLLMLTAIDLLVY